MSEQYDLQNHIAQVNADWSPRQFSSDLKMALVAEVERIRQRKAAEYHSAAEAAYFEQFTGDTAE